MPRNFSNVGTGTSMTPAPLGIKTNSCPATHPRAVRTALGIDIWNFEERTAASDISYKYKIDQKLARHMGIDIM